MSREVRVAGNAVGEFAVADLDARTRQDLVKFVVSECKKAERVISPYTAECLLDNVGEDMGNLVTEIEKLCNLLHITSMEDRSRIFFAQ